MVELRWFALGAIGGHEPVNAEFESGSGGTFRVEYLSAATVVWELRYFNSIRVVEEFTDSSLFLLGKLGPGVQ